MLEHMCWDPCFKKLRWDRPFLSTYAGKKVPNLCTGSFTGPKNS